MNVTLIYYQIPAKRSLIIVALSIIFLNLKEAYSISLERILQEPTKFAIKCNVIN